MFVVPVASDSCAARTASNRGVLAYLFLGWIPRPSVAIAWIADGKESICITIGLPSCSCSRAGRADRVDLRDTAAAR
jgi:hypothetical protein